MTKQEAIRRLLELPYQGMTQREVAKAIGVSQQWISKLCKEFNIQWHSKPANQWGKDNFTYVDGLSISNLQRITRRVVTASGRDLHKCERCNISSRFEYPRHHKDRNKANNTSQNLEVLCHGCHNQEHMSERRRGADGRLLPKS